KYVVFKDANWDWRTFNLETDVALADKIDNGTMNAINPDLTAFQKHGGKLLVYHGGRDQNFPLCLQTITTKVCSIKWARERRRRSGCACLSFQEWGIVEAVTDRTRSMQ